MRSYGRLKILGAENPEVLALTASVEATVCPAATPREGTNEKETAPLEPVVTLLLLRRQGAQRACGALRLDPSESR